MVCTFNVTAESFQASLQNYKTKYEKKPWIWCYIYIIDNKINSFRFTVYIIAGHVVARQNQIQFCVTVTPLQLWLLVHS